MRVPVKQTNCGGGITLWVIVMLVVFAVIFAATLQLIARQSHATIVQEQEEQAFGVAEAGVQHVVWLLNSGAESPRSLEGQVITREPVRDNTGVSVAHFSITFERMSSGALRLRSTGYDVQREDICQTVIAEVEVAANGSYHVVYWDHVVESGCGAAGAGAPARIALTAAGTHVTNKKLTSEQSRQAYTFAAQDGDAVQIKVTGSGFTPEVVLRDPHGILLAARGQEWRLAHVRYEAVMRQMQQSISTFVGGSESPEFRLCHSSVYNACIPRDPTTWFDISQSGNYVIEIASVDERRGEYDLLLIKRP